ncbi:MAG: ABC transporter permease [Myxococcales bacterium]|nr:ABC transporter permease [Myxococcales bacterium]
MRGVTELAKILSLPLVAAAATARARGKGASLVVSTTLAQVTHTAQRPFVPLALVAALLGVVVAFAANKTIGATTFSGHLAQVLAVAVTRELTPLVVSLVLVARTGNQLTIQLGLMRAGHELDALEVSGIDPYYFVVLPRVVGVTLGAMALAVCCGAVGMIGGHGVARLIGALGYTVTAAEVFNALAVRDLAIALLKSGLCGLLVASTSCHFALTAGRSPVGVREAAERAALWGFALTLVINLGLSVYGFAG